MHIADGHGPRVQTNTYVQGWRRTYIRSRTADGPEVHAASRRTHRSSRDADRHIWFKGARLTQTQTRPRAADEHTDGIAVQMDSYMV